MVERAACRLRMTKGRAMVVWARGINSGEVSSDPLKSGIERLKVTIKPRPRVTADAPRGSMMKGSIHLTSLPERTRAEAAGKPERQREQNRQPGVSNRVESSLGRWNVE
jgi:hypothetical protein